jgi:hypothetical protein
MGPLSLKQRRCTVDAEPSHYRHFDAEFWTIYDRPSDSMAQEI